jgi:hypothetical protein
MSVFTIKARVYHSTKLGAIKQAHLMRRLLPLVASLTNLGKLNIKALAASAQAAPGATADVARDAIMPIANAIAELSDEQFNYIIDLCMGQVRREEGEGANIRQVQIWNRAAQALQYEDIDLPVMLQICGEVIMENLAGFLPAGSSPFSELLQKAQTSSQ